MKYSDSIKTLFMSTINEFSLNPENYARNSSIDFPRNRKLGFKVFLPMFLTMEGDCIKEELYRYFGRTTSATSKTAYYKQRAKLKPDALKIFFFFPIQSSVKIFIRITFSLLPAMIPPQISF